METVETDKGLVTGVLALQLGFVSREAVVGAIQMWSRDSSRSLLQLFEDWGAITPEQFKVVESLATDLSSHGSGPYHVTNLLGFIPPTLPMETELEPELADPTLVTRMPSTSEADLPRGRFRRLRTHAEGGLGVVYVARDTELNREVALKEIKEVWADHNQSRARFLLEAEVTGGLEHPGIVPVYSLGRHQDGRPYYAMRFVRGLTLQESIDRYHKMREGNDSSQAVLEFQRLIRVFLDVCNTIGYAHSRGVIHRDIKPVNIMLGKFGETLVVDWGLAKTFNSSGEMDNEDEQPILPSSLDEIEHTLVGSSVGTPGYMSPEQATGRLEKMGPTSDLFSMGATLYAILTGQPPFRGKDLYEILGKMGRGEVVRPRQINSEVPRAIEAICLKAMAIPLADRYQTAAELAGDIEHWLADEAVSALDEGWGGRVSRWGRKHRTTARVLSVALVLMTTLSLAASFVVNTARLRVKQEMLRSESLNSGLSLDRALARLDRGEGSRGMLRLEQSLSIAPAGADDLKRAIRTNLGGWGRHLIPLSQTVSLPGTVQELAFSRDGRRLVTGCRIMGMSESGALSQTQVWEVATGEQVSEPMLHEGTILAIETSDQGTLILSGGGIARARIVRRETRQTIATVADFPEQLKAGAFAPGGKHFALAGAHGYVRVWNAEKSEPIGLVLKHPAAVHALAFSPDGTRLVTGCNDGIARVWDLKTSQIVGNPLLNGGAIDAIAFRPDGLQFATAGAQGLVRFWDAKTLAASETVLRHEGSVYAISYNATGTRVITGCEDNRARLWDAESGKLLGLPIEFKGSVEVAVFAPDGNSVATGSGDHNARIWDIQTAKISHAPLKFGEHVGAMAYLTDGKTVLVAGKHGKIQRCDAQNLQPISSGWTVGGPVKSLVVKPSGGVVIVIEEDDDAVSYDPISGTRLPTQWLENIKIGSADYHPNGRLLMTGGSDGYARFLDVQTGKETMSRLDHRWPISVVAMHPKLPIALTAGGGFARLWDLNAGREIRTLPTTDGPIYAVAFSSDGEYVATGGEDSLARVRRVSDGGLVSYPLEHNGSVVTLAFSPDGKTLLTGGHDGKASLWDVETSKPLGPEFRHAGGVSAVVFDASGRFVLTAGLDGEVRTWPVPSPIVEEPEFIKACINATTGMELDTELHRYGVARVLDRQVWLKARSIMESRGGAPWRVQP